MAAFQSNLKRWLRRIVGPTFRELSRTGKIMQTLWDAAQLQAQQRDNYRKVGEIAIGLVRERKLENMAIERIIAKIDRSERILKRQELALKSYQSRADIREIMREDRNLPKDSLETI